MLILFDGFDRFLFWPKRLWIGGGRLTQIDEITEAVFFIRPSHSVIILIFAHV